MAGGNSFIKNPQKGKYNPAFNSAEIYKSQDNSVVTVSSILNGVLRPGETIDFSQEIKTPEKPKFDNYIQKEQAVFVNEHKQDVQDEIAKIPAGLRERVRMWGPTLYLFAMNHSCDPGAWWNAGGDLVARCQIEPGLEITYDYATLEVGYEWQAVWECKCGTSRCRRRITSCDLLDPEIYWRYNGHLPRWVEEIVGLQVAPFSALRPACQVRPSNRVAGI